MIPLESLVLLAAITGYGDPVDGYPSADERTLVLWTNAARVAPDAFTSDYRAGGCSTSDFARDERQAKAPLYLDLALTEAARFHSDDMRKNGCFQHDSCDGTDTWDRVARFYRDSNQGVGENIAYGSDDPRYTVLSMWMCSEAGHRANIMSGDFNEMGAGVSGSFMTQDFAAGELKEGSPPVRVASEIGDAVYADWGDDDAPARLVLNVDGERSDLVLNKGTTEQGIYYAAIDGAPECTPWRVEWQTSAGDAGSFPATGGFRMGGCEEEYDAAVSFGSVPGSDDDLDGVTPLGAVLCGTPTSAGALALALASLAAMRRRRA
jgi:hypothetical protein